MDESPHQPGHKAAELNGLRLFESFPDNHMEPCRNVSPCQKLIYTVILGEPDVRFRTGQDTGASMSSLSKSPRHSISARF
jgi:hypothetical protein